MENIDLIVTWPKNCDYPLWRNLLRVQRGLYKKVIIVWMEANQGNDYKSFVEDNLAGFFITFIDSPKVEPDQDWRNVAVNAALEVSDAPWVWFTEQDFFVINHDRFWPKVREAREFHKVVGLREKASGRLHPCCLFVKRGLINRTTKNFAVTSDGDHFARFTKEITSNQSEISLEALGLHQKSSELDPGEHDYLHLNGLSHNHTLIHDGNYAGVYQPAAFKEYLRQCLDLEKQGAEFSPLWKAEVYAYLNATDTKILT